MQYMKVFSWVVSMVLLTNSYAYDLRMSEKEVGIDLWASGKHVQAVDLWRPLAEAGDAESMLFMGFAHRTGRGAILDNQQAFYWYKQAAEHGQPEAQFELGLMYELGLGTHVDPGAASHWYSAATHADFCPADLPAGGRLGAR